MRDHLSPHLLGTRQQLTSLCCSLSAVNYTNNTREPTHPGETVVGEPTWGGTLSPLCPNAAPEQHICKGVAYCGKAQNEAIGRFVREQGFGGVFPWAANYDSFVKSENNSLARWLGKGLRGD